MSPELYGPTLRKVDHRLLWWLLASQEVATDGTPTGLVPAGWRNRAMEALKIPQPILWKSQERLKAANIIETGRFERTVRIRGQVFGN